MASGIQTQQAIAGNSQKTLYTVPPGTIGTYKIIVRNKTNNDAFVSVWYTKSGTSEKNLAWHEGMERSIVLAGEILDAGQKIIIKATHPCVVTLMGLEEEI